MRRARARCGRWGRWSDPRRSAWLPGTPGVQASRRRYAAWTPFAWVLEPQVGHTQPANGFAVRQPPHRGSKGWRLYGKAGLWSTFAPFARPGALKYAPFAGPAHFQRWLHTDETGRVRAMTRHTSVASSTKRVRSAGMVGDHDDRISGPGDRGHPIRG